MIEKKIHKNFRLNGRYFTSEEELLHFSEKNHQEILPFLTEWFSDTREIIVQTSGSTGKPKKIAIPKNKMINSAEATGFFFNLPKKTTALLCLSPNYIAGKMMLVRALVLGWNLDFVPATSSPLQNNKKYDFVAMVPLQVQNSLENLDTVKTILVGGGVMHANLIHQVKKSTTKIFQSYGMTETVTHIAVREIHPLYSDFYTTLPNVRISNDTRGCLVIDAPKVANEIVVTNDLVDIISENKFIWIGRVDNIINSGGIKLIPEQIEQKLAKIITSEFFIAKAEDTVLGEKVIIFIEGKPNKDILNKIKNSLDLTKYEKPKNIYFINTFIRTETGKINRLETKDTFFAKASY